MALEASPSRQSILLIASVLSASTRLRLARIRIVFPIATNILAAESSTVGDKTQKSGAYGTRTASTRGFWGFAPSIRNWRKTQIPSYADYLRISPFFNSMIRSDPRCAFDGFGSGELGHLE
jgi:hypothetical protein